MSTTVLFKRVHPLAVMPVPAHGYKEDAGADLRSVEDVTLMPLDIAAVSTGLQIVLEPGYEAQIRSRSGLAYRGVVVANSPGTIDPGYRGEIKVILANYGIDNHRVKIGDKIAQMVIAKYWAPDVRMVDGDLPESERGEDGFGSTGE